MPATFVQSFRALTPILIVCCLLSCRHDKKLEIPDAGTKDSLLIYIMAGQSNMAGRGAIEPQDTVTNPRIYTIDSGGNLVPAREPLHLIAPGYPSGLDCGISFAQAMLHPFLRPQKSASYPAQSAALLSGNGWAIRWSVV